MSGRRVALRPVPAGLRAGVLAGLVTGLLALLLHACAGRSYTIAEADRTPQLQNDAIITADGRRLALQRWHVPTETVSTAPGEGPIVLAVHGFNDYRRAFDWSAPLLASDGITVLAYDQGGFGEDPQAGLWPGRKVLVADLRLAVRLIKQAYPDRSLFLLGQSMGAAVVILGMQDDEISDQVAGTILVAPAVWGWSEMNIFYRMALWSSRWIAPGWKLTGEGLDRTPTDNMDALRRMSRDPLVIKETRVGSVYGLVSLMDAALEAAPHTSKPILVLYGEKDEIVPDQPVRHLVDRLGPRTKVHYYKNGFHMLLRDHNRTRVIADIIRFIERLAGQTREQTARKQRDAHRPD